MISKQKKIVEKPKKSAPKKNVKKVNKVNVDKIVKIIKKFITKCGTKNKKKGGGLKDMLNRLTGKKNDIKNEDYGGECFTNLKNIDGVFYNIRDDIKSARDNLINNLNFFIDETTTKKLPDIKIKLEEILNSFELNKKFISETYGNIFAKIYKYPNLWYEINTDDPKRIISTLMIISALEITISLFLFREKMIECVQFEIESNSNGEEKKGKLSKFKEYKEKNTDNIYSEKEILIYL
jgi:hypothetical protein